MSRLHSKQNRGKLSPSLDNTARCLADVQIKVNKLIETGCQSLRQHVRILLAETGVFLKWPKNVNHGDPIWLPAMLL